MVREKENLFVCEECGLKYKKRSLAEKCEDHCRRYHACNLEITKHSVKLR